MDLGDTLEQAAFREEVRQFIQKEAPKFGPGEEIYGHFTLSQVDRYGGWFQKLGERRWIAAHWPKEYGGAGLSTIEHIIFNEEMARARAPRPTHLSIGLNVAGPLLLLYGTEEQKRFYLSRIAQGEDIWCQGFSEAGSGSDLASLQTRAVREGDDYVVNGQKVWTSYGHLARWMVLMARTDPEAPKHRGISCLIMDMKASGVTVNPLMNMAGTHEFNRITLQDVRVPTENLLGQENMGWYEAARALDFERSGIGSAIGLRYVVEDLARFAREHAADGGSTLAYNGRLRYELADRYIEAEVARMFSYWIASLQARGEVASHHASMTKVFTMELNQRIAQTAMKVLGLYGQLDDSSPIAPLAGRVKYMYLRTLANTLEGGSSEIQRNIIAQRGLGLPRG